METLNLALVTDIHHGPSSYSKVGDVALSLLNEFVEDVNTNGADLVIDLGDRINDANKESDFKLEQEVIAVFNKLNVAHVHLLGNHDLEFLSREDNAKALAVSVAHQSLDIKGYHLVFWQPDADFQAGFCATQEQLEWLEQDLASTNLPTLIFSHAPFSGASMVGHFYFQNSSADKYSYRNASDIRNIIRKHGHVIACISGHVHWNTLHTVNGVHYLTLQSLTESWTTQGQAAEAWTQLELSENVHVKVRGNDPFEAILRKKNPTSNWLDPIT